MPGIAAGMLSAGLYLVIYGLGLGSLLMLIPTLPLFSIGLSRPPQLLFAALVAALSLVLIVSGGMSALYYAGFIGIPVLLFAPAAHAGRPTGEILADITVYAFLIFIAVMLSLADEGGFRPSIMKFLRESVSAEGNPEMQAALDQAGETAAILAVAVSGWWWILLVWIHALIARWMLAQQGKAGLPKLGLGLFHLPLWHAALPAGCFLTLLAGNEELAFSARILLLISLLPWFLLGLARLNAKLKA